MISRLVGVLESEPQLSAVGVNFGDATELTTESPARSGVRTAATGHGRYVLTDVDPQGPVMIDTSRGGDRVRLAVEVLCVCG